MMTQIGKILISRKTYNGYQHLLVDIPPQAELDKLLGNRFKQEAKNRIRQILMLRSEGKTRKEIGLAFGLSVERVRQFEARAERVVRENYWPRSKPSLTTEMP